ncbi:hypothetical protein NP493_1671g00034 [Ridgeia piscesae]|uniref:Protein quiver n=1 Tax=Ridgeia piscesae TaxID=27915 RepID=A0AAD9JV98_RIDPI|nr:hypothetical protein NP493_1671g00034 [Ridgeia piscesae]
MQLFLASVLLVFVAVAIVPGEGLKCYECEYPAISACEDPVGHNVSTCIGESCGKGYAKKSGDKFITRFCVGERAKKEQCEGDTFFGVKATGCVCTSNLCNGASFQSVSVVSVVTVVLCAVCAARWL